MIIKLLNKLFGTTKIGEIKPVEERVEVLPEFPVKKAVKKQVAKKAITKKKPATKKVTKK